ncbi:hypothetical protein BGP_0054 [Beggiatoa sp. PS]|nr:hypothetical protein BGP_0054 [Beggiatoa sp. PS]
MKIVENFFISYFQRLNIVKCHYKSIDYMILWHFSVFLILHLSDLFEFSRKGAKPKQLNYSAFLAALRENVTK